MSNRSYSNIAAVRTRIIVLSLAVSGAVGGTAFFLGCPFSVLTATIVSALFCSLLCAGIIQRILSEIRSEQFAVLARVASELEMTSSTAQPDDIIAIFSIRDLVEDVYEVKQKKRQELLEQIFVAQEKLKLTMHGWSIGDEKETSRVQDAVRAIELLNNGYSKVIAEIDELSGRTEERASISTQMSATTDAIAENINQYSNFVIETSSSIEEMARATRETA